MSGYRIRPAVAADAVAFSALSRAVAYRPETADGGAGFLVFQGTPEEYTEKILANPHTMCAESASGEVEAYLLAVLEPDNYLLVDQICVSAAARGAGLAQQMLDAAIASARPAVAGALIMHEPVRNVRSLRFFTVRNCFELKREVEDGKFVWGCYERKY